MLPHRAVPGVLLTVGVLAALCVSLADAQALFQAPFRYFPTGGTVAGVAVGRLNGDATVDAALTHPYDSNVVVMTGTPRGDFVLRATVPMPNHPWGIAIGDINRDGTPDVVTGGDAPPGIVVLRGQRDGTFVPQPLIATPHPVDGLIVVDLNGDGALDVMTSSIEGSQTLLNNGSGALQAPHSLPAPYTYGITYGLGRINADAFPDLVLGGGDGIFVFIGQGDGTFGSQQFYGGGCTVTSLVLGDFDTDGDLDVVGVDGCGDASQDNGLVSFMNDGSGTLTVAGQTWAQGDPSASLAVGDMDGDDQLDLLSISTTPNAPALNFLTHHNGQVFMQNFARDVRGYRQVVTRDVNGDGAADAIQADGDGISLYMGSPTGAFGTPSFTTEPQPIELLAARIDDGPSMDLGILRDPSDTDAITFALAGGGTFQLLFDAGFGSASYFDFADVNGDSHPDLVTGSDAATNVYFGSGTGAFTRPGQHFGFGGTVRPLRLDSDAAVDLMTARWDSLATWHNQGNGTFELAHVWTPGGNLMRTGDLDNDEFQDLVLRRGTGASMNSGSQLVIRMSQGNGNLGSEIVFESGSSITDIRLGYLDGDDFLDVLIARGSTTAPAWFRNQGDGSFAALEPLDCFPGARIACADFNQDGLLDVASLAGQVAGNVAINFGYGNGHFDSPLWYGTGKNPIDIVTGDFESDGNADVAVLNAGGYESSGSVDLLVNRILPGTPVSVSSERGAGSALSLGAPLPNPSRGAVLVSVRSRGSRSFQARILDVQGRQVRSLVRRKTPSEHEELRWDCRDARGIRVLPGVYFLDVRSEAGSATRRIVIIE